MAEAQASGSRPARAPAGGWTVGHEVVRAIPVPTLVLDAGGRLLDVSDSWRQLLDDADVRVTADLLPGADLLAVLDAWARDAPALAPVAVRIRAALEADQSGTAELAVPFPAGDRWFIVAVRALPAREGGIVMTLTDITERRAAEALLAHQANHDVLTGLPNRALLSERLRARHEDGTGTGEGTETSVFFLDLDDFKQVNDTFGHEAGDVVLVEVARRLKQCVRDQDFVARLGGDEFVVVAEGLVGDVESLAYADRLAECVAVDIPVLGHVVTTSASIGVATTTGSGRDDARDETAALVRHADIAMLQAKASGRGQVGFDRALDSARRRRSDQVHQLRQALQDGELHAEYQPIVRLSDTVVVRAEALARWTRADGTTVPPSDFIPLAERTGMITPIDRAVLLAAAQALVSGALGDITMRCSVNSSPKQVPSGLLLADLRSVLAATGLDARRLTVEVTETAVLGDPSAALEQLQQVKQVGVGISLDDFGTGYSSLTHLTVFPIDMLKVDRSFVARMLGDVRALEVIRAIVDLGRALDMEVVAEGIETPEQRDALHAMGCPLGQAWLYGPAVPAAEFMALAASVGAG